MFKNLRKFQKILKKNLKTDWTKFEQTRRKFSKTILKTEGDIERLKLRYNLKNIKISIW